MNSIKEVTDWLYTQVPVYQNHGSLAYKPNLKRINLFVNYLGNPQNNFKSIHVAGTNGKGSTCHMSASILQESGYIVGLYTSPHLKNFSERIKINGIEVSSDFVIDFIKKNKVYIKKNNLSFFEITTGMAFKYFSISKVDIAVIEVGLGGRLDATNVISPEVTIITNIGLDHTNFLGNNRRLIAKEKAGIIKNEVPVIIGEKDEETTDVFKYIAEKKKTNILWTDDYSDIEYSMDLKGDYQVKNMKCAFLALKTLKGFNVKKMNFINGFLKTSSNTGLRCRWEIINDQPITILDISHNKDGFSYVVEQLKKESFDKLHMVLGFVKDKNIDEIFKILPTDAKYYLCKPSIERGLELEELIPIVEKYKLSYLFCPSVIDAFNMSKEYAANKDLIYVGGSTFVCAEFI